MADMDSTFCCGNELPYSWTEGLPESKEWFKENFGKHVEGYHLLDGEKVVGHIYYTSSEKALLPYRIEEGVACIYCTEMLRDYMYKGYGRMMFDYVKDDLKKQGFKGILVAASDFKEWMHHELFLKQGFKVVMEHAPYKVMYFPLTKDKIQLEAIDLKYPASKEKVEVTLFKNFNCPVNAYMYHLVKKVAKSFGKEVKITEIPFLEAVHKYGIMDPLINGKIKFIGPASEEHVRKAISEEIDNLRK